MTINPTVGTRTSLTTTALNSLASATYVVLGTLTHDTNKPVDVLVELTALPGTVTAPSYLYLFAQTSLDGTNFTTGPTSGTTTTDEGDLYFIGALLLATNATSQTKTFSLSAALGGSLPYATKLIAKNATGAALNASGGSCYTSEISIP